MERGTGLAPIVDRNSRILILGSLPGAISRREQKYYSHGGNAFWKILAEVYGETINDDYEQRITFLRRKGLAIWDVLDAATVDGSSDATISEPVPNDFAQLFADHPGLRTVAFNGSKAAELFDDLVLGHGAVEKELRTATLISSSSARAVPLADKVAAWRTFLLQSG